MKNSLSLLLIFLYILGGCSNPRSESSALYNESRVMLRQGKEEEALIKLNLALEKDPSNVFAHTAYQDIFTEKGKKNEMLLRYKDFYDKKPSQPERLYLYARLLDRQQSQPLYEKGLTSFPAYGWFFYGMGLNAAADDPAQALPLLQKSVQGNIQIPDAYIQLGRLHAGRKDLETAHTCFFRAAQLDPLLGDAPFYLGNLALIAGNIDEAEAQYLHAKELNPKDRRIGNALGKIRFIRGNYPEAAALFRELHAEEPGNARYAINCARTYYMMGETEKSLEYLSAAPENSDQALEIHLLKALVFLGNNETEKALSQAYLAGQRAPENQACRTVRALIDMKNGREPAPEGEDADLSCIRGVIARSRGNREEAEKHFRLCLEKEPDYYPAVFGLGWALETAGHYGKAAELYRKAALAYPEESSLRVLAARVCLQDKKTDEAVLELQLALEKGDADIGKITGDPLLRTLAVQPKIAHMIKEQKPRRHTEYESPHQTEQWIRIKYFKQI